MIEIESVSNISNPNGNLANKESNKNVIKDRICIDGKKGIPKLTDKVQLVRPQSYGEIVPSKCELNCDAPLIPYQYQKIFNINKISNQENYGNVDNFINSFRLMKIEDNCSYMKIYPPPHIILQD